jgi:hypothetical protein
MSENLAALQEAEKRCYASCSDYSCLRSGGCTGVPAQKLRDYWEQKKRILAEDAEYLKFKNLMDRYIRESKFAIALSPIDTQTPR